jgi:hypothetical protein
MRWLRYVAHDQVAAYLANGWRLEDDLTKTHHGFHAVLMIWAGDDEPAIPGR